MSEQSLAFTIVKTVVTARDEARALPPPVHVAWELVQEELGARAREAEAVVAWGPEHRDEIEYLVQGVRDCFVNDAQLERELETLLSETQRLMDLDSAPDEVLATYTDVAPGEVAEADVKVEHEETAVEERLTEAAEPEAAQEAGTIVDEQAAEAPAPIPMLEIPPELAEALAPTPVAALTAAPAAEGTRPAPTAFGPRATRTPQRPARKSLVPYVAMGVVAVVALLALGAYFLLRETPAPEAEPDPDPVTVDTPVQEMVEAPPAEAPAIAADPADAGAVAERHRDALAVARDTHGDESAEATDEHLALTRAYIETGELVFAKAHFRQARKLLETVPATRSDERIERLQQLGDRLGME